MCDGTEVHEVVRADMSAGGCTSAGMGMSAGTDTNAGRSASVRNDGTGDRAGDRAEASEITGAGVPLTMGH
jgi:membrane protease subunit (stomatin/prohibitin family)